MQERYERRLRILIVDDDEMVRECIARTLDKIADVTCAANIETALAELDQRDFDALVTDNDLQPGSGIALLRHAAVRKPRMRRILMSGADIRDSPIASCWDAFFLKPFDPEKILHVLVAGAR